MSIPVTSAVVQVPGEPGAPVIVDFDVHALRVALVSRDDVLRLPASWSVPGVYVLIGALDGRPAAEVYVGKAIKVRDRLGQHRSKPKLSWWRAVAVTRDTTAGFNSAEIGYLEGRLYSELLALPGITLKAEQHDLDTTLPSHLLVQLDAFVPTILAALRLAGLSLWPEETQKAKSGKKHQQVPGTIADLLAAGLLTVGATLTFRRAGKTAEATVAPDGQLIVAGKAYESPSAAAASALDLKAANGWVSWKLDGGSGPTLADLRAQLAEASMNSGSD